MDRCRTFNAILDLECDTYIQDLFQYWPEGMKGSSSCPNVLSTTFSLLVGIIEGSEDYLVESFVKLLFNARSSYVDFSRILIDTLLNICALELGLSLEKLENACANKGQELSIQAKLNGQKVLDINLDQQDDKEQDEKQGEKALGLEVAVYVSPSIQETYAKFEGTCVIPEFVQQKGYCFSLDVHLTILPLYPIICKLLDKEKRLKDQILASMQQKLDDLCEQVNCAKDQPQTEFYPSTTKSADCSSSDSVSTDCWLCDQHRAQMIDLSVNHHIKAPSGDEAFKRRLSISNHGDQEERRMSDFSDWASSVTSAADLQLNSLAIEQDIYNLKRECDEKDAALKELFTFIRSNDIAASKRIEELEDTIRRKNTIITKLKKDMIVLEQKVMNLARGRRRSYSSHITETKQLPTMADNVLYDMDSSTSPSSDSDCSSQKNSYIIKTEPVRTSVDKLEEIKIPSLNKLKRMQKSASVENSSSSKLSARILKPQIVSPLKEKSVNQRQVASLRSMENFASASTRSSKRSQNSFKEMGSQKRCV